VGTEEMAATGDRGGVEADPEEMGEEARGKAASQVMEAAGPALVLSTRSPCSPCRSRNC
jgi:hypothetical protein